jgi:xanthine dehydrogenase YagT iron-sulfur-binding subunit
VAPNWAEYGSKPSAAKRDYEQGGIVDSGRTALEETAAQTAHITLKVNGGEHALDLEPRVSLLDALREYLHLTGSKKGCNQGACGACTVLCDGERILSCLALAVQYDGVEITTIEGLAHDETLHPLQAAFVDQDGFQCGYCTPGQICSAIGMVREFQAGLPSAVSADVSAELHELTEEEVNERMSGNLCRCGAYVGIRAAIREAFQPEVRR